MHTTTAENNSAANPPSSLTGASKPTEGDRDSLHPVFSNQRDQDEVVTNSVSGHKFSNDTEAVVTKTEARAPFGNYTPRQWPSLGDCTAFVRVRRRTLKGRKGYWGVRRIHHTSSLSFDLVQAVRINGKPRQKFLLGLGSIKNPEDRKHIVVWFWAIAIFRLTQCGIKPKRRQFIITQMVKKGARLPSAAMCDEFITNQSDRCIGAEETRELRSLLSRLEAAVLP